MNEIWMTAPDAGKTESQGDIIRIPLADMATEFVGRPVLMLPAALEALLGGHPETSRYVGSARGSNGEMLPYARTPAGTAIIPVMGPLTNRQGRYAQSYEMLGFQLAAAGSDPDVANVVLDIDSPGGHAAGAFEAAAAVRALSETKPVMAVVNSMAASAAFAIAIGANRIVTTPSGIAGSIGAFRMHADLSRMLDRAGITPTMIAEPDDGTKTLGNPYEPLSDAAKREIRAEIAALYEQFVGTVAGMRKGLSARAIRAMGARTFTGQAAVDAGLADEVGTFETALSAISRGAGRRATRRATMEYTQADLDKARTEGHAAGRAEGFDAGKAEGHKVGIAEGAAAERERAVAILFGDEAKSQTAMAHRCVKAGMSADDAKEMMLGAREDAAAGKPGIPPLGARASAGMPSVGAGTMPPPVSDALSPDELAAAMNKQLGGTRH